MQGSDVFVQVSVHYTGKVDHIYFGKQTVPAGLSAEIICFGRAECWLFGKQSRKGQWNEHNNPATFQVRVAAGAQAKPGDYEVALDIVTLDQPATIRIPVHVTEARRITGGVRAGEAPPIPGLKKWRQTMLTLGRRWCDPSKQFSFGWEGDVWYYDGARVYFQIEDYTGNHKWDECAMNIARQYRDFVVSRNGAVPGWRNFATGMRMAYERTHDESYKKAVLLMAANSPYARRGGAITDDLIRETAYALDMYVEAEKLGERRNPLAAQAAAYLLGDFEALFVRGNYTIHQTFFDGLAAEALIGYYELSHDASIPPAIKTMLDWLWDRGSDQKHGKLIYNPDPVGPRCKDYCQQYQTVTNNLIAPAFAWYYSLTGDVTYQQRGDVFFEHALDEDISYSGKIFSQNFRWSFDYVKWRGGK